MIDNQGRIRGRVSIIDIVIVVAILALVAGFVYRRATPHISDIFRSEEPFYVTFEVNRIRGIITEDSVIIGESIFRQHATHHALGTIVHIEHLPATEIMRRTDGTAVLATMEGRYSLRITIEATGNITPSGYFVNGNDHLSPGGDIRLVNSRFFFPVAEVYYVGTERPF